MNAEEQVINESNLQFVNKISDCKQKVLALTKLTEDRMYTCVNYKKDGGQNNAPLFNKRGHIAELLQSSSFQLNAISRNYTPYRFQISNDKMGINAEKSPLNDELSDINIIDCETGKKYCYQSKVCKDAAASIKAATREKYIANNVIPLVPADHSPRFGKISIGNVSSDAYSLSDYDKITRLYTSGTKAYPFQTNKTLDLLKNSTKSIALSSAGRSIISDCTKVMFGSNISLKDMFKNAVKQGGLSAAGNLAAFGSKNPDSAFKIGVKFVHTASILFGKLNVFHSVHEEKPSLIYTRYSPSSWGDRFIRHLSSASILRGMRGLPMISLCCHRYGLMGRICSKIASFFSR